MQDARNPARRDDTNNPDDGWLIVDQRESESGGLLYAWAHDRGEFERADELHRAWAECLDDDEWQEARERLVAEFPPTRWVTAMRGGEAIRITGDHDTVVMQLPATLRAIVDVEERTAATAGKAAWSRHSQHEITIEVERDVDGEHARVAVAAVSIRRLGRTQVTAGVLRDLGVGELVDWMLTRGPVVDALDDYLGPGHPAAASVRRATGRKSGKRGDHLVTPAAVADVVRSAEPRGQDRALRQAFPNVGMRTLKRALAVARSEGLVEYSPRSRPSSSQS